MRRVWIVEIFPLAVAKASRGIRVVQESREKVKKIRRFCIWSVFCSWEGLFVFRNRQWTFDESACEYIYLPS